jgi:proteic killer suppression protein
MIKSFADKRTQHLYLSGRAKGIPADLVKRAARKLEYVDLATLLEDLKVPPGNRLESLAGSRQGQYSIRVNEQWRICFRFTEGDAFDVKFCDYH